MAQEQTQPAFRPGTLLIDPEKIQASFRMRRVVHRPIPYEDNPLMLGMDYNDRKKLDAAEGIREKQKPDMVQHDWDMTTTRQLDTWFNCNVYGRMMQINSVVRSPMTGKLQMYYHLWGGLDVFSPLFDVSGGTCVMCYAESDNGIYWDLPELNRVEVFGSKRNNVMFPPIYFGQVIVDTHETDPARRYKAFLQPGPSVAYSPDGINWSDFEKAHLTTNIGRSDSDELMGWDDRIGKYVAFLRPWKTRPEDDPALPFKRKIGRAESDDFLHWDQHTCVLMADDEDMAWSEIERMSVFKYGDMYFGLANIKGGFEEEPIVISHMMGYVYVELVWSRDGIEWNRFEERDPFFSVRPGVRDFGLTKPSCGGPVVMDDQLYFYYDMSEKLHGAQPQSNRPCLARLTRDRFMGWKASEEEGWVQTTPFECPGGELVLNADVRDGHLRVAIVLEGGMSSVEHAAYRCVHVQGDGIEHRIRWQRTSNLDALQGNMISLKIYLRNGEVFSYRFV